MKKFFSIILVLTIVCSALFVLSSCSGEQFSGSYKYNYGTEGLGYSVTYVFSAGKVEIQKEQRLFGNVNNYSYSGKYEIKESSEGGVKEITISVDSKDQELKIGTFSFEIGDGYILIDGQKFEETEK